MPAIDLLLEVKPESERLHQIILGALLARTELAQALGVESHPVEGGDSWEPQGGLFDLQLDLVDGTTAWFELKIDGDITAGQVDRQLDEIAGEKASNDVLYYALLGLSCFQQDVIQDRRSERPKSLAKRVRVITANTVTEALRELPIGTALGGDAGDARALASAYVALLRKLELRHERYDCRPPTAWSLAEIYGVFNAFTQQIAEMSEARFRYTPNPSGGRMVCWWGFKKLTDEPESRIYLQWELPVGNPGTDLELCLKIEVPMDDSRVRRKLRDATWKALNNLPDEVGAPVHKPAKFGNGRTMTIAIVSEGPVLKEGIDWEAVQRCVTGANDLLDRVCRNRSIIKID